MPLNLQEATNVFHRAVDRESERLEHLRLGVQVNQQLIQRIQELETRIQELEAQGNSKPDLKINEKEG